MPKTCDIWGDNFCVFTHFLSADAFVCQFAITTPSTPTPRCEAMLFPVITDSPSASSLGIPSRLQSSSPLPLPYRRQSGRSSKAVAPQC